MSTFWLIYLITLGVVVLFTAIIGVFFRVDDKDVSISHIVLADFLGAIPCVNVLVALILIIIILVGVFDLEPKY